MKKKSQEWEITVYKMTAHILIYTNNSWETCGGREREKERATKRYIYIYIYMCTIIRKDAQQWNCALKTWAYLEWNVARPRDVVSRRLVDARAVSVCSSSWGIDYILIDTMTRGRVNGAAEPPLKAARYALLRNERICVLGIDIYVCIQYVGV